MKTIVAPLFLLLSSASFAQTTLYVSDNLDIALRAGPTADSSVVKNISIGTRLETVDDSANNGMIHVRTESGEEGWVVRRYLSEQAVAGKDQLSGRLKRMEKLLEEEKLKSQTLNDQLVALQQQHEQVQFTPTQATTDVIVDPNDETTKLKAQTLALQREMNGLKQENIKLSDQSSQRWFLLGAGLCLGGVLLGMFGPRLSQRKKNWGGL
ncbi:MAG: TIGR04211 family SH3 domain-containing protein [Gammaproteobacteria bacterium]|nr:TIGR04211 family SH3 domain-containing protein [Gammaproteobacteria bacterium]